MAQIEKFCGTRARPGHVPRVVQLNRRAPCCVQCPAAFLSLLCRRATPQTKMNSRASGYLDEPKELRRAKSASILFEEHATEDLAHQYCLKNMQLKT